MKTTNFKQIILEELSKDGISTETMLMVAVLDYVLKLLGAKKDGKDKP